ncbi:MAG: endonuclease Q family protein [Candidatus Omnitrophota bacterium]|nr:endonuclease Q family protein [Candidatus Omnitrophota bacterium]
MPRCIADFHIHSRYSRACSKDLSVSELAKWAKIKGIGVLGTGDFTHPLWVQELKEALRDTGRGLFEYQGGLFLLTAEVNTLFYKGGKAHQIHHLLFAPSFEAVERINRELEAFGSLSLDGRPTLRMDAWRLVEIVIGIEPRCLIVPAHAWTPWFAIFGSTSGFDAVEDCFEHQAKHIFALETGLSSDPAMNWRLSKLDRYTLISNSDSHSARRIGREANLFDCAMDYDTIIGAIKTKDRSKFLGTLEFFPEEGKYHYDGHRHCKIRWAPTETKRRGFRCPTCGRKVTVGVMHRVETLADRPEGTTPANAIPFQRVVSLDKIIADALGFGVGTQAVERDYQQLIYKCGTEFAVLLDAPEEELRKATLPKIAEGILRMRQGRVTLEPGYDGEYGKIKLFDEEEAPASNEQQMTLF